MVRTKSKYTITPVLDHLKSVHRRVERCIGVRAARRFTTCLVSDVKYVSHKREPDWEATIRRVSRRVRNKHPSRVISRGDTC
jgi:hypothetical protein